MSVKKEELLEENTHKEDLLAIEKKYAKLGAKTKEVSLSDLTLDLDNLDATKEEKDQVFANLFKLGINFIDEDDALESSDEEEPSSAEISMLEETDEEESDEELIEASQYIITNNKVKDSVKQYLKDIGKFKLRRTSSICLTVSLLHSPFA